MKKTHCKRGHPRTPDNLHPSNRGCLICARESNRETSRKRRENNSELIRAINLASIFGLDKEAVYQYLLDRKNVTVCDICRQECSSGRKLALDHNHKTNEIRGLLCSHCNTGLGQFMDSSELLRAAVDYLEEHKE